MTATVREQILEAINTLCEAIPEATVYRSRTAAVNRAEGIVILVEPGQDTPEALSLSILQWKMNVKITVFTRGAVPESIADPFVRQIHAALSADLELGGLTQDILPILYDPIREDADQSAGQNEMSYVISYRTTRDDLTRQI